MTSCRSIYLTRKSIGRHFQHRPATQELENGSISSSFPHHHPKYSEKNATNNKISSPPLYWKGDRTTNDNHNVPLSEF